MKCILLVFLIVIFISSSFAQKPPVDYTVYDKWPSIDANSIKISNNGKYVIYNINNLDDGSYNLVLQDIGNGWKKKVVNAASQNAVITADSRRVIFIKKDTLSIVRLGTDQSKQIPNVTSYKTSEEGRGEWLVYQLSTSAKEVILHNLSTGKERQFASVTDYFFSAKGNVLLLETEVKKDSVTNYALQWIDLPDGNATTIWQGEKASNYTFDAAGTQLAFIAEDKKEEGEAINTLWYYKKGMDTAVMRVNKQTIGIAQHLAISKEQPRFSKDGSRIFFTLRMSELPQAKPDAAKVDVWNYSDAKLQSQQLRELSPDLYVAVINSGSDQVIQLTKENEDMEYYVNYSGNEEYVAIRELSGDYAEGNWNLLSRSSIYLVSTKDGSSRIVKEHVLNYTFLVSLNGNYIVYYDLESNNYFSYNVKTGITNNISAQIPVPLYNNKAHGGGRPAFDIGGWLEDGVSVLIYDEYDIWQVDLEGKKKPLNITAGLGRRNNIVFRYCYDKKENPVKKNEKLLLAAFDLNNKHNGFYYTDVNNLKEPEELTMGPFVYYFPNSFGFKSNTGSLANNFSFPPIKTNNNIHLVWRMSAVDYPNLYTTRDFKTYTPLSNLQPQKKYNWLTTELVRWKTFDGSYSEGVLYKPENFDSNKKYPVIFYFYEINSCALNFFNRPGWSEGQLNIPSYVSNDYLVFVPDISYKIGDPGESAYNSIVSAARCLSKMPWVDSTKMGIQGHSFGGYEVNYLITRTNLFACAASCAGITDLVSSYGAITAGGKSLQYLSETGQTRMRATLWQAPELYIKNSPIFNIDRVQTPLLMMHNKNDYIVPWYQGVAFFTGLRRLGKRVWMLQYDENSHSVEGKEGEDFTIRLAQFFDHYLKGTLAPKWMTRGIPARMKGIDDGLELDNKMKTSGPGLLTDTSGKMVTKKEDIRK